MKKFVVHASSLNLLKQLLAGDDHIVIAFDPHNILIRDEDPAFFIETNIQMLEERIGRSPGLDSCIFHLGDADLKMPSVACMVRFNNDADCSSRHTTTWDYIGNPNGSARWLYPAGSRKPWFLSFYNFSYWKARLYKNLVKMAFACRLARWIRSGRIYIHHQHNLSVTNRMDVVPVDDQETTYAIFTGTMGPNRKAVVAEIREGAIRSFLKIAVNTRSAGNLMNEYRTLRILSAPSIDLAVVPVAERLDEKAIRVSNIRPALCDTIKGWGTREWQFLGGMYRNELATQRYQQLQIVLETRERIHRLISHPRLSAEVSPGLGQARQLLLKLITLDKILTTQDPLVNIARCHGDLTPWNTYGLGNILFVYDWELSRPDMPLLFDLFHYMIQGQVFSKNAAARDLQQQLSLLFKKTDAALIKELGLDTDLYLRLYLLYNAAYYLEIYLEQQTLHEEVYRLFTVWNDLLGPLSSACCMALPVATHLHYPAHQELPLRNGFIRDLFARLRSLHYVVLKSAGKSIYDLAEGSDIDLLTDQSGLVAALRWIAGYPGIQRQVTTPKSFMTTVQLFFTDNSYISIDLLTAFHRKSIEYISADTMLANQETSQGIKLLTPAYDYLYIYLFYQLNGSDLPEKYTAEFEKTAAIEQNTILGILQKESGIIAEHLSETFSYSPSSRAAILSFLRKKTANRWPERLGRYCAYWKDVCGDLLSPTGVMLTFSGVDGAGKSTVLGEVKDMLRKKYRRKVVVIRHRPSLLPILSAWKYGKAEAEKRCVASLPRKGNNDNFVSSICRFAYYYTDYLLGQCMVYMKYILRGYVVLYDRYYFDFIVDGERSNIRINAGFIRQLYRFIYKPRLNIFLYALPEVILLRKQELSAEDISQLTQRYQLLFSRLGNRERYLCIENNNKQETIDRIEKAYISIN